MICEFLNASTKISVVIAVGLLVSAFAVAPSSSEAAETPKLPSRAEIENAMQRSFGYDPSVTWNILDIRESAIPELVDVLVSMNKNTPQHIYFSERNHYAVVGEMMPFGSNP
jgi:hypothetical protein